MQRRARRSAQPLDRMNNDRRQEVSLRSPSTDQVIFSLIGIYFVSGAIYSFATGRWFAGFPPILDVFSFLFGSSVIGAYAEGFVAALLGVVCIGGVVLARRRVR